MPFDVEAARRQVLKQPGNFFFLTETSLFGTNPTFQAKGVEADLDGDGKVEFGEALPDANDPRGRRARLRRQARELDEAAQAWKPTEQTRFRRS